MAKNRKSKTRFYEDDLRAFIFGKKKKTTNLVNPFTGEQIENHAQSGAQRAARAKKKAGGGGAKPKPFSLSAMLKEQRAKDQRVAGQHLKDKEAHEKQIDQSLRSAPDREKASGEYQENYRDLEKSYDAETQRAIEVYTGDEGFQVVNEHLRAGGDFSTLNLEAKARYDRLGYKQTVQPPNMQALQDAANEPLANPSMTYRGVSNRIGDLILDSPGGEYTARGMTSTSMNPKTANSYSKQDTMLQIRATKGAPVNKYSSYDDELEIVQAHGARYKIVEVEKRIFKNFGQKPLRMITMEQVE